MGSLPFRILSMAMHEKDKHKVSPMSGIFSFFMHCHIENKES